MFNPHLDHVVMADKDGVLFQLCDGHNVHQLMARHYCLCPVRLLQLVAKNILQYDLQRMMVIYDNTRLNDLEN